MKNICQIVVIVAVAAFCGCTTPPACPQEPRQCSAAALPPLKVGVYADRGPGGIGAVEWFRLVHESPEMELKLLDGKMVREGALDGLDLLIMPGGSSMTEFDTLGTNGVERMKAFVRNGGGYVGTCAGCCLLMDGPKKRARMMPWNTTGSEGNTMFPTFRLNAKGEAETPTQFDFLSIDDSYGHMPDQVPQECIPHLLDAERTKPDQAGPLVWVYQDRAEGDREQGLRVRRLA